MVTCNAQLLRFRGDKARCELDFEHRGECRLDERGRRLNVLAIYAAYRGNTWIRTRAEGAQKEAA